MSSSPPDLRTADIWSADDDEESAAADDGAETEDTAGMVATLLLCAAGTNADADAPSASRQRALRAIMFGWLDLAMMYPQRRLRRTMRQSEGRPTS